MNNYEINEETYAIISKDIGKTEIIEKSNDYIIDNDAYKVMDESCKYFGSSYEGRKEGSKSILGAEYKVPIVVEDTENLIVFPTTSPYADDCVWISLKRISNIYKIDACNSKIVFDNNKEIIVPCSFRSLENQLARASRLDLILRNRKNS